MTKQEIERLRQLLESEACEYAKREHISDLFIKLDENSTYGKTTLAEILVFGIEADLLPRLQIAYMAYEELIDIIFPSRFSEEFERLIIKTRAIVPPVTSYGYEIPFETGVSDEQSFRWFSVKFLGLPDSQAAAIYDKHKWSIG